MKIKIKKVDPDAKLPTYGRDGDAGMDFYALHDQTVMPGDIAHIATGIALEIPDGHVGLFWDKSGLSLIHGITVLGGVVDSNFRGAVTLGVINLGKEPYTFEKGHKVMQMLFQPVEKVEWVEVDELSETIRGDQKFGSSGK